MNGTPSKSTSERDLLARLDSTLGIPPRFDIAEAESPIFALIVEKSGRVLCFSIVEGRWHRLKLSSPLVSGTLMLTPQAARSFNRGRKHFYTSSRPKRSAGSST